MAMFVLWNYIEFHKNAAWILTLMVKIGMINCSIVCRDIHRCISNFAYGCWVYGATLKDFMQLNLLSGPTDKLLNIYIWHIPMGLF